MEVATLQINCTSIFLKKNVTLSQRSQVQKITYDMIAFKWNV